MFYCSNPKINLQNSIKNNKTFTEADRPSVESFQMSSERQILSLNMVCSKAFLQNSFSHQSDTCSF